MRIHLVGFRAVHKKIMRASTIQGIQNRSTLSFHAAIIILSTRGCDYNYRRSFCNNYLHARWSNFFGAQFCCELLVAIIFFGAQVTLSREDKMIVIVRRKIFARRNLRRSHSCSIKILSQKRILFHSEESVRLMFDATDAARGCVVLQLVVLTIFDHRSITLSVPP